MAQLDKIQKDYDTKQKPAKGMKDAVESTEEIRRWVSSYQVYFISFRNRNALFHYSCLSYTLLQEEHTWSIEKLLEKLITDQEKGLSADQASDLFQKYGENALTDKTAVPWYIIFLHELTNLFNLLLVAAALLCFIGYGIQPQGNENNLVLGFVLILIVFITAILSFA